MPVHTLPKRKRKARLGKDAAGPAEGLLGFDNLSEVRLRGSGSQSSPFFIVSYRPCLPFDGKAGTQDGVQWHTIYLTYGVQWSTRESVQTVVETPTYLAIANKLFSEEERADIVALVAADPKCGDVIRGTGGFRKVRVARKGMGKSGGARVVYIWRNERFPVFLITVFPKNEKENLSMAERNALKKRADSIFETYGR